MEKLELRHLAPYLPYGLKIQGQTHGDIEELEMLSELSVYVKSQNSTAYGAWADLFDIKPLLRTMSELTENEMRNLHHLYRPKEMATDKLCDLIFYWGNTTDLFDIQSVFEYLYKNHFDVFGLIEKGLAVSLTDALASQKL